MSIPKNFKGIFYGPESGAEFLFDHETRKHIITLVSIKPQALFLYEGAIIDLRINGFIEEADDFESMAKKTLPIAPWGKFAAIKEQVDKAIASGGTELKDIRKKIFNEVHEAFTPNEDKIPEEYVSIFFDEKIYGLVFGNPYSAAKTLASTSQGGSFAFVIGIELIMNGSHKAEEFLEAISQCWDGFNISLVKSLGEDAQKIFASGRNTWKQEVQQLILNAKK